VDEEQNKDNFLDDAKIRELIHEALSIRIESRVRKKKQRNLDNTLGGVVGEFLNSFVLFGYDFSGNPITLKLAPTIESNEALKSLLIKVFAKEMRPTYDKGDEIF
jgi:hypothetical protein